jgi:predicted DsbA family dithiol-disulfide isomerase
VRIERLRATFPIVVKWTAFPLHPETPPAGQTLEALFAGQPVNIAAMLARLRQVARELGLPFGERKMTFNSRLAQELGKWAEEQGHGDAFHHAVFLAYFQRGENIARQPVLRQICAAVGLDPAAAQAAMDQRSYREAVDQDWQRSRQMGITAVPTFVLNGQRLVGAQTDAALEAMVISAGVGKG